MSNVFGRQVILPFTNKSGGSVAAGDVVVLDTANNDAFTTTTTGRSQTSVGIAQQSIASNAVGLVLVSGYAALVNVPASVTRGHYIETHTVAKQATGNSTRRSGSFGQFTTGGTTPSALLWGFPDNAGATGETVATSAIWTTSGKVAVATGTATATEQWPPGHLFDYVEKTSDTSITGHSNAAANTIVTGAAVTYDGSTAVWAEFSAYQFFNGASSTAIYLGLFEDGTSIGILAITSSTGGVPCYGRRKFTPSAGSHTYSVRAYTQAGTGGVAASTGGVDNYYPCCLSITKA